MKKPEYADSSMRTRQAELRQRLVKAIEFAIMAPSSHNTQPWKFRLSHDWVELIADRTRSLPVVDPHDRELMISCGAALYHLRLAMKRDGLASLVQVVVDGAAPDLVARVRVSGPHTVSQDDRDLFDAIPRRRTNRGEFDGVPVNDGIKDAWTDDAASEGCWIETMEDEVHKHGIADLIAQGDRLQASDRKFRVELARWIHPNRTRSRDGMPGYSHGIGNAASYLGPFVVRTFDWGAASAAKDRELAEGAPLLAVLGTPQDAPRDWIACGQALSKILLRGTVRGLSASFLNQPVEVDSLRPKLTEMLQHDGFPQILLRWGHGRAVDPTPRRRISEFLVN